MSWTPPNCVTPRILIAVSSHDEGHYSRLMSLSNEFIFFINTSNTPEEKKNLKPLQGNRLPKVSEILTQSTVSWGFSLCFTFFPFLS